MRTEEITAAALNIGLYLVFIWGGTGFFIKWVDSWSADLILGLPPLMLVVWYIFGLCLFTLVPWYLFTLEDVDEVDEKYSMEENVSEVESDDEIDEESEVD